MIDDQSDYDDVYRGGDGDCLGGDDGVPDCLCGGVRVHGDVRERGGVCVCGSRFCDVGGSGSHGGRVRVGCLGRRGVDVHDGVHGPGHGHGVLDHGVADLQ